MLARGTTMSSAAAPWRRRHAAAARAPPLPLPARRLAVARPPPGVAALALVLAAAAEYPAPEIRASYAPAPASSPSQPQLPRFSSSSISSYAPGAVLEISGPDDYASLRAAHPDRLVVLMCKARSCRPCKAFTRKYAALAARFPEAALLEIYGDDSPASRQMMIAMGVRVTPTFRLSRGAHEVGVVAGTSEGKLRDGIVAALTEGERSAHPDDVEAWRAAQEEAAREAETQEKAEAQEAAPPSS